jgi:hypothetical protein
MVGMLPPNVLDAKDIKTESEQERPPFMFPKARCEVALLAAVLVESFFEEILCKDACLWETVHALLYFDLDCTIVGSQVVTKSGGRLMIFMRMYSGQSMGVLR